MFVSRMTGRSAEDTPVSDTSPRGTDPLCTTNFISIAIEVILYAQYGHLLFDPILSRLNVAQSFLKLTHNRILLVASLIVD